MHWFTVPDNLMFGYMLQLGLPPIEEDLQEDWYNYLGLKIIRDFNLKHVTPAYSRKSYAVTLAFSDETEYVLFLLKNSHKW